MRGYGAHPVDRRGGDVAALNWITHQLSVENRMAIVFPEGTMTFLTGHSGAGKSTFLRLLLRTESPTRGQIFVNDVNIVKLPVRKIPAYRQNLGAVFQDHHLLAERSVYEMWRCPSKSRVCVSRMSRGGFERRCHA